MKRSSGTVEELRDECVGEFVGQEATGAGFAGEEVDWLVYQAAKAEGQETRVG